MWTAVQSRLMSEEGTSLVEYAFLVTLIALVVVVAVTVLGVTVSNRFAEIAVEL